MAVDFVDGYPNEREFIIFASAARTATPNQQRLGCRSQFRALSVVVDMTAVTATGTVTVAIDAIDPASGKAVNLLTSAALSTVATTRYRISPDLVAAANVTAQDHLPPTLQITATHGNGVSMTYSVGAWFSA
jgi:hypothetical protein